ncbi:OmpA family protein [Mucilaginibacter daejeonensis]|uniref:OmpA family protein n=1 Tax=Mucilaginibacter daejeonensis TaxID=398049 RepID=UPI001D170087|nr:OmpA family protein [Mucilaginibacter daejeonensis]UEG55085.1 OmpA family protein [Mucilaginibacter daejeonensis]
MKVSLKKLGLVLTGLGMSSSLLAQTSDSTKNYVKPLSGTGSYRVWSIGIHGGMTSLNTLFQDKTDYMTANEKIGYGGYVKAQVLHTLGIQGNFFRGTLQGSGPRVASYSAQRFKTDINYAVDLAAVFTLANINWSNSQTYIQPYISAGAGNMAFKSTLTTASGAETKVGTDNTWYIPVGAGFKINLGPSVNLDLGYQVNFVNTDGLDQYYLGDHRDKFGYAHAGLEFSLGSTKKPQLATHNPVASIRNEYLMGERALQIQLDQQKAENAKLRTDLDAMNANVARLTADSDGDGVLDINDKCPGTPSGTKVDGSGCPLAPPVTKVIVTEEDRRVVKDAIKNLEFDLGKATIRPRSFPSLDRVAQLLIDKNFSLKLAGHTDNTGSAELNMRLSKDRAESIKAYLVEKGANASRIEAVGYGMTQPIATNKTAAGRQANRRVEFTLY